MADKILPQGKPSLIEWTVDNVICKRTSMTSDMFARPNLANFLKLLISGGANYLNL
jgi:hypothetical protein